MLGCGKESLYEADGVKFLSMRQGKQCFQFCIGKKKKKKKKKKTFLTKT
jgi:hypothetical protein